MKHAFALGLGRSGWVARNTRGTERGSAGGCSSALARRERAVAGFLHRRHDCTTSRRRIGIGFQLHLHRVLQQVYRNARNARHARRCLFHPRRARRASHARYGKTQFPAHRMNLFISFMASSITSSSPCWMRSFTQVSRWSRRSTSDTPRTALSAAASWISTSPQ